MESMAARLSRCLREVLTVAKVHAANENVMDLFEKLLDKLCSLASEANFGSGWSKACK